MEPETIARLEAISRAFYEEIAGEFSATRQTPWPGWRRVLAGVGPVRTVLDVGCGNARFFDLLPASVAYTGVDACPALLADAAKRGAMELIEADLWDAPWGGRRFDLVVAFGVFHHIPGSERRRELVGRLAAAVAPGGHLAFTAWRFDPARAVPWSNAGVEPAELEPGDYLLGFGWSGALRYAHLATDGEIDAWVEGTPLDRIDDFEADGRDGASNRYLVLRARR